MARKFVPDVSADLEVLPSAKRRTIAMSEIKQIKPEELRSNKLNETLFDAEDSAHLQMLQEDVRKRGILVPLIAKRDGTLLAGHNRLQIALALKLHLVPVQYVQETLSEEAEREFIIKDNLLRRQLSSEKKMSLYKQLYPDFEETFLSSTNKGGRTKKDDINRLTIAKVAEDTGQKETAVRKQIQRHKEIEKNKTNGVKTRDNVSGFSDDENKHSIKTRDNVSSFSEQEMSSESQLITTTKQLLAMFKEASEQEREQAREMLRKAAIA
jgi:ParB-like chromosome segregation protein Spo0J